MTVSNLNIRRFSPEDLQAMQEVRQAAFRPVFESFRNIVGERIFLLALSRSNSEQAQHLERVCRAASDHEVFVATLEERVVGFVSFTTNAEARMGEIGLNAVHPDRAGVGIGTELYEYTVARLKECGMALAIVKTGGDPSHAPARRAYEKAGFAHALPSVALYKLL